MWRGRKSTKNDDNAYTDSVPHDHETVTTIRRVLQNSASTDSPVSPSRYDTGLETAKLETSIEMLRTPTPKKMPSTRRKSIRNRGRADSATDFEGQPSPKTPKLSSQKQCGSLYPIRGSAVKAQALFKDIQDLGDTTYGAFTPDGDWKKNGQSKARSWSSEFAFGSPFTKVAEACDLFCRSAEKLEGAPISDPLPPNRQLTADSHEKKIYTGKGGKITILRMSPETLQMNRRKIALPEPTNQESSDYSSDDVSD